MTYNVFSGTFNPAQSINQSIIVLKLLLLPCASHAMCCQPHRPSVGATSPQVTIELVLQSVIDSVRRCLDLISEVITARTRRDTVSVRCAVTGYLKSLSGGLSVNLVRVYSQTAEYEDFPMPGHVTAYKTGARLADSVRDRSLQSISLHHLVREGDSRASQFIRSMDELIHRCCSRHHDSDDAGDDGFPSEDDLELYRVAIKEREHELLMTADVILCTCVAAAASRITSSTNVLQVSSSHWFFSILPIVLFVDLINTYSRRACSVASPSLELSCIFSGTRRSVETVSDVY